MTKPKAVKWADVHSVLSILKVCCAVEVDLRLALAWVPLCAPKLQLMK